MPHSSYARHAVVDVVTDAIGIGVRCAVTATHAQGVELVCRSRNLLLCGPTQIAQTVADAALSSLHAVIHVTDAYGVRYAVTSHAQSVELVAVAVSLLRCQNIRTRRSHQDRCRCRTRRVANESSTSQRCHRHRRRPRSHHHTHPRRRAGFVRNRLLECQHRTRRSHQDRCRWHSSSSQQSSSSQMPSASASDTQSPHTPKRRAGCRRSRSRWGDVRTSALVDGTRSARCRTRRVRHAVVYIVADAIGVGVRCAVTTAHAQARRAGFRRSRSLLLGCQNIRTRRWRQDRCRCRTRRMRQRSRRRHHRCHRHRRRPLRESPPHTPKASSWLPSQSQSSFWDVRTSALVDGARTVADAALVELAYAVVHVITDAIGIGVRCAVTAAHSQARRAGFRRSRSPFWDVRTSALVDGSRAVADAALVVRTHAVVNVVADAIGIGVRCTVTAAHAQGVELVPSQSQSPSGCQNIRTRKSRQAVADAALVVCAHAVVDVAADAIGVGVRTQSHRTRPRRRAGCRRSRSLLLGCQNIRTRRWRQDRCRCRTRRTRPHSRPRRRRCHRHRRPLHSHRHTRQARRAGCRRSRSRQWGCQNIRTRRWHRDHRTRRTRPRTDSCRRLEWQTDQSCMHRNRCNQRLRVRRRVHFRLRRSGSFHRSHRGRQGRCSFHRRLWPLGCSCRLPRRYNLEFQIHHRHRHRLHR